MVDATQAWDDHVLHLEEQNDRLRAEVRALTARLDTAHTIIRRLHGNNEYLALVDWTPAEATEIRAATADPTPQTDTDTCRIYENGSVAHRFACQFGDDCPATDDPRVKAAQAKAQRLPTADPTPQTDTDT